MKNYITPLLLILVLASCQEDNEPVNALAGTYRLATSEIEIGFTVSGDGQIHNFDANAYVRHAAIPESAEMNNNVTPFDRFKNGYGRIEIISRGEDFYRITLIYNRFSGEGLSVYDVQVDIAGEPFIVLPDQVFTRVDNP